MAEPRKRDGINKRRAHRKAPTDQVNVVDAITGQDAGHLGNLSETGLMLISKQAPRHNSIRQLVMSLPGSRGDGYPVEVGVQAMWHRQAAHLGSVWAGYRIISIDADATAALGAWLSRH